MSKNEFISQLRINLNGLPKEEIENAVLYYNEYFDEAGEQNEDRVTKELGSPSNIASQIIANYTINNSKTYPKSVKKGISNIFLAIGALFASTVAIPFAIAIAAFAFALVLTIFSLVLAFGIITVTFSGVGVFLIGISITLILQDIATAILVMGVGFLLLGIGIISFIPVSSITKKGLGWIARFVSKILLKVKGGKYEPRYEQQ